MEPVNLSSSVPNNYVFEQIISPLSNSLCSAVYDNYYCLVNILLEFAKTNGVLPYDQTLGGRYIEYALTTQELPDDHPEVVSVMKYIDALYDFYDACCRINTTAAEGGYITPVVVRDDTGVMKANISSFSTGLLKDIIVTLNDLTGCDVTDLGGGGGGLLDTFQRMGVDDISSYVNVDTDVNSAGVSFDMIANRYTADNSIPKDAIQVIHRDINEYIPIISEDSAVFSIHSLYYVDSDNREALRKLDSSGIAHFSDLLFDGKVTESDPIAELVLHNNSITGSIGTYRVLDEPLLFTDDVGIVYPARFHNSVREHVMRSDVVAKSLCMWSSALNYNGRSISPMNGIEYQLRPAQYDAKFKMVKIHKLDDVDYYFLRQMGFYVSAKIDGLCGFLSFQDGAYYVSFRDGNRFIVLDPSGRPVNMGIIDGTINVEVLKNHNTGNFQFWYIGHSPQNYPDAPKARKKHVSNLFTDWVVKVETAKHSHPTLFYKPYAWVPPGTEKTGDFDLIHRITFNGFVVPFDGIVLHDPFGYFVGFWKPWNTSDIMIKKTLSGLVSYHSDVKYFVNDPKFRFITDGIYEVYASDGDINIIQSRLEKQKSGDIPHHNRNNLFEIESGIVKIAGLRVKVPYSDLFTYVGNYGVNYRAIMASLVWINLPEEQIRIIFNQVRARLNSKCQSVNGFYTVSDFIESISLVCTHSPIHLWQQFLKLNLVNGRGPYDVDVADVGGIKAIISIN